MRNISFRHTDNYNMHTIGYEIFKNKISSLYKLQ